MVISGGGYDEEGQYIPHSPDESESESGEEEEEEESAEHEHFGEVTEVRFPGEVGPLGDRRLCKIRCVKGKWVGPLCATNEEGKSVFDVPTTTPHDTGLSVWAVIGSIANVFAYCWKSIKPHIYLIYTLRY